MYINVHIELLPAYSSFLLSFYSLNSALPEGIYSEYSAVLSLGGFVCEFQMGFMFAGNFFLLSWDFLLLVNADLAAFAQHSLLLFMNTKVTTTINMESMEEELE